MSMELEAKISVRDHDDVRARLIELGAEQTAQVFETNHIFDDSGRTLLAGDRGLRIRVCRTEKGEWLPATLTYKGPRQPGALKQREEIEIRLDDPAGGRMILERLGFVEAVRFEKRRESWRLKDCLIELDQLPYLGCYVEIEGPDEDSIRRVQDSIGLASQATIRTSYIALLVEHCRRNGLPADEITFAVAGRSAQ